MQTRKLILSSVLAALAIAAGSMFVSTESPSAGEASLDAPEIRWRVGEKQRYAVDIRSEIEVTGAAAAHYVHRLGGDLDVQVFAADADGVRLGCQLSNTTQSIDGEPRAEPLLSSFFVATATPAGRFTAFQFPQSLQGEMRNRLREMMRLFQVVVPDAAGASWTTTEEDANGAFEAVYRVAEDGEIRKARLRYRTEDAKIVRSRTTARLSGNESWLDELTAAEKQSVRGDGGYLVTAATDVRLRRTASPAAWTGSMVAALSRADAAVTEVEHAIEAQRRRPATEADWMRFRELIAELEQAGKLGNGLLDALRDAMLDCPELALAVPGLVGAGDLQDLTASTLIHALRMAGHGEAQQALGTIANDTRQSRQNRTRAIIDLGGVARPNEDACEALWALSLRRFSDPGLADTAMLSLGRVAKSLHAFDETRYEEMRGQLAETLRTAADSDERSTVLTALGNTGDDSLEAAVAANLDAFAPQVRAAAAKALGRFRSGSERIFARLETERTPNVRRQLVESLRVQRETTAAHLERVDAMIATEADDRTRLAMARYLGTHLAQFPGGKATLRDMLHRETNNRIRKYVAGVVYARK